MVLTSPDDALTSCRLLPAETMPERSFISLRIPKKSCVFAVFAILSTFNISFTIDRGFRFSFMQYSSVFVRCASHRRAFIPTLFTFLLLTTGIQTFADPGALDTSFGGTGIQSVAFNAGDDSARAVAVQSDGKIIAGGYAKSGSSYLFALVRYDRDGSLDTTFDTDGKVTTPIFGADDGITGLAVQADGKIIAGGYALSGSNYFFALARYNPDGSLDTTFDTDGKVTTSILGVDSFANAVSLQSNGKILLSGGAYNGTNYDFALARYNADGSLDSTFDADGKVTTTVLAGDDASNAVTVGSDGKIVAAGFAFSGANSNFAVVRYNSNGSLDTSFDADGKVTTSVLAVHDGATGVAVQTDLKIVAAGYAKDGTLLKFALVRYNFDGSLDTSFDTDGKVTTSMLSGNDAANALRIQSNGKILVSGAASNVADYDIAVARYNPNGSLDTSFDTDGKVTYTVGLETDDVVYAMAIDGTGQIVVAGETSLKFMVARLDGDPPVLVQRRSPFDFDGDAKTDLAIFRPNGAVSEWWWLRSLDGGNAALQFGASTDRIVPVDYTGDGKTDLAIFRPNGAVSEWWWLRSSDGGNAALQFGASTDRIVPVDYTGDGKTDVAFWRPSTGQWFVLRSEDFSFFAFPFGATGDVPVPADFDGDNKADAAVFRESSLTWFINKSTGGTDIIGFGAAGDKPVVTDYDGDAKADIAIYRPNGPFGAEWWVRRSTNGVVFATQFGQPADKAVPGDYTGDGKADIAFWTPSSGNWFVLRSEDFSYFAFPFGAATDIPVPGDYDGDGKLDAAVFRPSNSTWFANRSGGGTLIQQFGITGDVPVPSAFVR